MAFSAPGLADTLARLDRLGIHYAHRRQAGAGTWQVFFFDPNGARVELDFDPARGGAGDDRRRVAERVAVMTAAPLAEIDHLVFAAPTLAQGIEHIADLTGVAPRPGGKHAGMGTHNALVKLGDAALPRDHRDRSRWRRSRRARAGSTSTTAT